MIPTAFAAILSVEAPLSEVTDVADVPEVSSQFVCKAWFAILDPLKNMVVSTPFQILAKLLESILHTSPLRITLAVVVGM